MARISLLAFERCVVIAGLVLVALASAQTRNRITQSMQTGERARVAGAHPLAQAEFDRGPVAGGMRIDRAAMVFKPSPAQQLAIEKLLAEQQDPSSANYRKWLTPEQYAERFGMSEVDLAKVSDWLKSQGLTVEGYSRSRNRVFFSGTAAQVAGAFGTEFRQYVVDGETHFANATGISVPAALSGMVLSFRGFDSFRPRPRVHPVRSNFTSHVSGNHFVAPGDFTIIYNLKPLYDSGLDGTGEKIAVVGQTEIHPADITAFRSAAGLPPANLQLVPVTGGGTGFTNADEVEADLDVEWSGGVAKNATILYVFTGASSTTKNVFDAFAFAIDNKLGSVISTSYGNCEAALAGFTQTLRTEVQQANLQGQTITAASGDSGVADCDAPTVNSAVKGYAVDSPASVPEVTAIGGSEFNGDAPGTLSGTAPNTDASATPFWGGTTNANDNLNSALSYIPEMAWNDTPASVAAGKGLSASGGGVSTVFAKPTWQNGVTPADGQRDVPDVSLTASPNHDPSLICSQAFIGSTTPTSCSAGFRSSDGTFTAVGGTSVGAPAFAGILALLNQATQSAGLGNINPTLYSFAGTGAFHDITTGDNIVPCTSGTPATGPASAKCPTTAPFQIGFKSGVGYDLVTGLGTVNTHTLVTSWPGFVATPDFSLAGTPVSISAAGQSGTSTITLTATNGFNGTINLACALMPASTTAELTCSIPATASVNGSSTTATLTVSTVAAHAVSGTSASLQQRCRFGWMAASGSTILVGVFLLGVPSGRRRHVAGLGLMLLVFFAAGMGCGGGSSSSQPKTPGTPAGSYSIAVTATSASLSHAANVAVTVQ
jgi:subtilase family serine protease